MEKSNPSNQEIVDDQLIEYIPQLVCFSLGEGAAVCEVCGNKLRGGPALVVFAFRPVDQPAFEIGHVKCVECRHEPTEYFTLGVRELAQYVGLLVEAIEYLDAHSFEYDMQLGGARNFGAGIVDAHVVNPLYSEAELRRVYNRSQDSTSAMQTKDDIWRDQCREEFVRALQARLAGRDGDVPMPGGDGVSGGESA